MYIYAIHLIRQLQIYIKIHVFPNYGLFVAFSFRESHSVIILYLIDFYLLDICLSSFGCSTLSQEKILSLSWLLVSTLFILIYTF